MLSLVHLIYMAGDKCMRQNACYFMFQVYGEATLIFPLIVAETFARNYPKKKEYLKTETNIVK